MCSLANSKTEIDFNLEMDNPIDARAERDSDYLEPLRQVTQSTQTDHDSDSIRSNPGQTKTNSKPSIKQSLLSFKSTARSVMKIK